MLSLVQNVIVKIHKFFEYRGQEISAFGSHYNPEEPLAASAKPAFYTEYHLAHPGMVRIPIKLTDHRFINDLTRFSGLEHPHGSLIYGPFITHLFLQFFQIECDLHHLVDKFFII